ncbi:MAG: ribosome silencing factor [Armatimonadetes bacterium]|nr:ribosome silencing factor [Armatimonadota bacterium]MDW8026767.1 ribosome silencing factor [Armatimonadota bacterium]
MAWKAMTAFDLAEFFCQIADEKKVSEIVVLNVSPLTTIADFFVIGTCENQIHIEAVADEMEFRARHELGIFIRRTGEPASNWVVLDAGDVIVHLFNPELRDYYDLENLWAPSERWVWVDNALKAEETVGI